MPAGCPPRACHGFSILELVAALAIVGFAILAVTATLSVESGRAARLAAREEAVDALEATIEEVRAGLTPLESTSIQVTGTADSAHDGSLDITLDVVSVSPSGLYRVEATARWRVLGKAASERLTTLVWRP